MKKTTTEPGGYLPPQALDIEEMIIGILLAEPDATDRIIDILSPIHFYSEYNKIIIESILSLYNNRKNIDLHTVNQDLISKNKEYSGIIKLIDAIQKVSTTHNLEQYYAIVRSKYTAREIIKITYEAQRSCFNNEDTDKIIDYIDRCMFDINSKNTINEPVHISNTVSDVIREIRLVSENPNHISGIPTGFNLLDNATLGWQPTDLIIIAGRPSMGKTAFALQLALNASIDYPVMIFSLEMSDTQITYRAVSNEYDTSPMALKKAFNLDWKKLYSAAEKVQNRNIYIDGYSRTLSQIRSKTRRQIKKSGIKMIIIDYIQLMTGNDKGNREQEISEISRGLKSLAKELSVPVIVLSQLSRKVEERTDKRPLLSDLRESGSIEQDADLVIFPFRPSYYGIDKDEEGNAYPAGTVEIIIKKNRNGSLATIPLMTNESLTKWFDPINGENSIDSLMPNESF